jgi:Cu2+-exporting ATPase
MWKERNKVVGPNYLKEQNIKIAETIDEFTGTVVYVMMEQNVAGYFTFSDQIRESSFEAIQILKEAGLKIYCSQATMKK